jgi:hypothetical protein
MSKLLDNGLMAHARFTTEEQGLFLQSFLPTPITVPARLCD